MNIKNHNKIGIYVILFLVLFSIKASAVGMDYLGSIGEGIIKMDLPGDGMNTFGNIDYISFLKKIEGYFGSIFTLYTVFIAIVIFMENKNPSKTISWLLVLFLVPVIGFILYLFLGQNMRKKNIFKKKKNRDFEHFEHVANTQREAIRDKDLFKEDEGFVKRRLISLILNNAKAPFTINNRSEVLTNGENTFNAIIKALKEAKHHIHLEYFVIKDDEIGSEIKQILIEKAKEGVEVRVIYDSVGSWKLSNNYLEEMRNGGVVIHGFLPVYFPLLSRELNYRNHRKIIVIDGKRGFVGGINIGDEYLGKDKYLGFWRDTHLKVEGEAVYGLQRIFLMDWAFVTKTKMEEYPPYFPKLEYYGEQLIQITGSGPDSDWQSIMQAYFFVIASAEDKIWINTPYLVPDDSIMMALKTAALSGVDVRMIIPSKPDHKTVFWASMSNVEELLRAGVKIYQYKKGFIHAKILLVDGVVSSIGTANLDIRSLQINFEVNAFIYDENIVSRMEKDFMMDIEDSEEIILEEFVNRPLMEKVKEATGRLFTPIL